MEIIYYGDGVENNADNCPVKANPDQTNLDNDGIGGICDPNLIPSLTQISVGNNVYKLLHPTLQSEFHEMHLKKGTNEWKYIDLENNLLPYKVYTTN